MRLPEVHELFEGRFRIERELGAGGFSRVFRARDERSGEPVALKVLFPKDGGYSPQARRRFDREVSILASLTSPHTVKLNDSGLSSDGLLFLVFEHVAGEDLSTRLGRAGRLSSDAVLALLKQVLLALGEAHDAGLVHRDIKPDNIRVFSTPDRPIAVKLLDFGIARSTDDGSPSVTATGELIGTPRYMSPEQLTARPLTPRSDIYSLGMVAFELLVGSDALAGNSLNAQIDRLQSGYQFSTELIQGAGPELLDIIQRMTARRPEERFASASAVLRALEGIGPGRALATTKVWNTQTRPPTPKAAFLIGALAVALVGALFLLAGDEPDEPPRPRLSSSAAEGLLRTPGPDEPKPAVVAHGDAGRDDDVRSDTLVQATDLGPVVGGSPGCGTRAAQPTDDAVVIAPDDYDPRVPHPVIVWLMADQDEPMRVPSTDPFQRLVREERVILIAPYGATKNDWRSDDAEIVVRAVEHTKQQYCVDEEAVFIISSGGSAKLTLELSCEPWVRAVAINSFLGTLGKLDRCSPTLWISPRDSAHVPIEGGVNCLKMFGEDVKPLDAVEERMRKHYGCRGAAVSVEVADGMVCRRWGCEISYESCVVEGGIGWPGTGRSLLSQVTGENLAGFCPEPAPSDVDATSYAWQFFRRVSARHDSD